MPDAAFWIAVTGLLLGLVSAPVPARHRLWPRLVQGGAIGLFALASVIAGGPALLSTALILMAVGVTAVLQPHRAAAFYGLAALALAHLCYILLFLTLSQAALWDAFAVAPIPAIAVVAMALSTELWLTPFTGPRAWWVRGGATLIAALMLAALTWFPVIAGAGCLAAAALLAALGRFRLSAPRQAIDAATSLLHIVGHALILWAVLAA